MRVAGDAHAAFFGRAFSYSPFVSDGRGRELGRPLALARSVAPVSRRSIARARGSSVERQSAVSRVPTSTSDATGAHGAPPARRVDSPSEAGILVVAGEGSRQRGVSVVGHWGLVARGN